MHDKLENINLKALRKNLDLTKSENETKAYVNVDEFEILIEAAEYLYKNKVRK